MPEVQLPYALFFCCRFIDEALFYLKLTWRFTVVFVMSLVAMIGRPILTGQRNLPFPMVPIFDYYDHSFWYWFIYVKQSVIVFFSGGTELTINLYIYTIIICIVFNIGVFGHRLRHFGYDGLPGKTKTANHLKVIEMIKSHIIIGE